MSRNTITTGLCVGLLAALCYGANVPFAKQAAQAGILGPNLIFYRAFLMVALLGGFAALKRQPLVVPRGSRGAVFGLGLATSMVTICYISSVAYIPVGIATILYYIYPLLILIISPFIDGERLTAARFGIFVLAFVGLFVALGPSFTSLDPRGLLLALLGAVGACAQFFFAARATRGTGPAIAGFWAQLIVIPIALAAGVYSGQLVPPSALLVVAGPVGMHVGLFVLAFAFHLISARMSPPAALGLVFCVEPVASIVLATRILGESLTQAQMLGGLLVLIAIVASVLIEGRKPAMAA